jgi:predicted RNase H-like HicB family nuclease
MVLPEPEVPYVAPPIQIHSLQDAITNAKDWQEFLQMLLNNIWLIFVWFNY